MTQGGRGYFDHVAIAVEQWSDGYPAFLTMLGGRWVGGGSVGEFAPAQIGFGGRVRIELIQPGNLGDGFVTRFLKKNGCGAHHLTFMVPNLADFEEVAAMHGLPLLGAFLEVPGRPETFLHPKESGFGTLLQAIQFSDLHPDPSPPEDLPKSGPQSHVLSWVAVHALDLQRAADFLVDGTGASVNHAESEAGSVLLEWEGDCALLLLEGSVGDIGIDHVAFHLEGAAPPSPRLVLNNSGRYNTLDAPGIDIIVCR